MTPGGFPLFERFPELRSIPRIELADLPTPVRRLDELGACYDGAEIWIKQNDRSNPSYGGNKVRKLEFLFAEAIRQDARAVATIGGIGSNHSMATLIFARQLGLDCHLFMYEQPCTDHCRKSMKLYSHFGASLTFQPSYVMLAARMSAFLATAKLRGLGDIYSIPPGGSSPLGTLGHVNAALELDEQIRLGELPEPKAIFVAQGSNGTLAGLVLGLQLAGRNIPIYGVRVFPRIGTNSVAVCYLINNCISIMKKHGLKKRLAAVRPWQINMVDGYLGKGYGYVTEAAQQAVGIAGQHGVLLDTTYTGKAFAAMLDALNKQGAAAGPVLFWNTFNSVDLSELAKSVDYHNLPPVLHRFYEPENSTVRK